ncbi:O-antigen ligase family protein [bacterium]|nr:O-antigen ligase family protein [bacterium]
MEIFIVLNLLFFTLLSFLKPRFGLFYIYLTLPSYLIRFSIFQIPLTLIEVNILILGLKFLWDFYNKKISIPKHPFKKEIVAWLLIAVFSAYTVSFSFSALGILKAYFFEPIILLFLSISYLNKKDDWKKIIYLLSIVAFFISIFAIYQKITGNFIQNPFWQQKEIRRVTSFFPYPNAIGLFLAPIIMLNFGLIFQDLKKSFKAKSLLLTVFLSITSLLSLFSLYFARSEGAIVALFVGIIFFLFFYNKKYKYIISIFIIVSSIFFIFNPSTFTYVKNKLTLQDKSGQIRVSQWQETWEMLKNDNNWLKGSGLSGYQEKIKPYHKEGIFIKDKQDPDWLRKVLYNENFRKHAWQPLEIYLYPHNIILNFWTELGIVGLIIFLIIINKYFFNSIKIKSKKQSLLLISVMIVIVIHGLVDVPYFKNDLSLLFWTIISLLIIIKNENTTRKDTIK